MQVIAEVMSDGVARNDEQIWEACRAAGLLRSLDVVRHARLALVRNGTLVRADGVRLTKSGTSSRLWGQSFRGGGGK
jgi:hypothetical protein